MNDHNLWAGGPFESPVRQRHVSGMDDRILTTLIAGLYRC